MSMNEPASSTRGPASPAEAGRTCPYCRFPLKEGADAVRCGSCRATHHAECWADNSGCAVMGCVGASGAHSGPAEPKPTVAPNGSPGSGRGSRMLIVAVLALAIAVGGVAVAIATRQTNVPTAPTPTATASPTPETTSTPPSEATPGDDSGPSSSQYPAGESKSEATREITRLLRQHHQALVDRDYETAWSLLTRRKQRQKLAELGSIDAWGKGQATFATYIDPSGLHVHIEEWDAADRVARVNVTGMRYADPRSSCDSWSGITWVRFEDGQWLYDPGYSTTAARRAQWKPRAAETLGWGCG